MNAATKRGFTAKAQRTQREILFRQKGKRNPSLRTLRLERPIMPQADSPGRKGAGGE